VRANRNLTGLSSRQRREFVPERISKTAQTYVKVWDKCPSHWSRNAPSTTRMLVKPQDIETERIRVGERMKTRNGTTLKRRHPREPKAIRLPELRFREHTPRTNGNHCNKRLK